MSRLGKRPILFDESITVKIESGKVIISSSRGERIIEYPAVLKIVNSGQNLIVDRSGNTKYEKSQHGLVARLLRGTIEDLTSGVQKELEFKGTGYRARVENDCLVLNVGYSHEISLEIPDGLTVNVVKNSITIEGANRVIVGEFAATVREVRPPEVYKGKGIKYKGEVIRRKAGKSAQTAGKAA